MLYLIDNVFFFNDLDIKHFDLPLYLLFMLTYSSYTDFLFSSARPLLYTSASRHHLFSSLLMQHHLFFLCSLRSRAAPCSPHPAQSTCRGWELWWKPCRRQRRPAALVHPTTSCIPHTLAHTNLYSELHWTHGLAYIYPASTTAAVHNHKKLI